MEEWKPKINLTEGIGLFSGLLSSLTSLRAPKRPRTTWKLNLYGKDALVGHVESRAGTWQRRTSDTGLEAAVMGKGNEVIRELSIVYKPVRDSVTRKSDIDSS